MESPTNKIRMLALIIDLAALVFSLFIYQSFFNQDGGIFILFVIVLSYFPALHWILGRTPGDFVFNLKVINIKGKKPGFWEVTDRFFGVFTKLYIINLAFNGIIMFFALIGTGTIKDIISKPLDYEKESKTFLIINKTIEEINV